MNGGIPAVSATSLSSWPRKGYRPEPLMQKLSIRDLPLRDKRVFVRVDFNVPLSEEGRVTDDTRIRETLPTLEYAIRNRAKLILASHLGRPKGKPNPKMSLKPVAERRSEERRVGKECGVR